MLRGLQKPVRAIGVEARIGRMGAVCVRSMALVLVLVGVGVASTGPAMAQGTTHPGCPLCPGGGYSVKALDRAGEEGPGRASEEKGAVFNTLLIAPDSMSEVQNSIRWGATERLELGITYLIDGNRFLGQFNYVLAQEREFRPALTFGLGVDRPGGMENALFLIGSKALDREIGPGWSGYLGAIRREEEGKFLVAAGAAKVLSPKYAATFQYDGEDGHLGVQTRFGEVNVSVLWLRMETLGAAIGVSLR